MIRSRALWILARLARADDRAQARRDAYRRLDPLVRGRVRRRVQREVAEARLACVHPGDEGHVHRLAFLELAGAGDLVQDPDSSLRRFESHGAEVPEPARRAPSLAFGLFAGTLVLLAAGMGWWLTRPPAALREAVAETADAWTRGGRPRAGSSEAAGIFASGLPDWVVSLDRLRAARDRKARALSEAQQELSRASTRLLDRTRAVLGADFASFLHAVLDQAEALVLANEAPATDSHIRSVDALNRAIADRGLGYYVDAEVLTTHRPATRNRVSFSTFRVERVRFYRSGEQRVRVLTLTRLDTLNVGRHVLGFTREQLRDALVLQERVEGHMVDYVLPSLSEGAPMPLVDGDTTEGEGWVAPLEQEAGQAGQDARQAARALVGDAATELGELLGRRRALFERWQERHARDIAGPSCRPI